MHNYSVKNILKLIKENKLKLRLYLGLKEDRAKNCFPMSIKPDDDPCLLHSPTETPYPLPDKCCMTIVVRELLEIIQIIDLPRLLIEWHRLTDKNGFLILRVPSGRNPYFEHIEKIYNTPSIWYPLTVRKIEDNKCVEYTFQKVG